MIKTSMEQFTLSQPRWSRNLVCANIFPSTTKNGQLKDIFGKFSLIYVFVPPLERLADECSKMQRWLRHQTDDLQPVSCSSTIVVQNGRGQSEVLLDFRHSAHPLLPAALVCPSSAHLRPFILLSLSWLFSRFAPCRYLHVFVFARRLSCADSTLWHTLDP